MRKGERESERENEREREREKERPEGERSILLEEGGEELGQISRRGHSYFSEGVTTLTKGGHW